MKGARERVLAEQYLADAWVEGYLTRMEFSLRAEQAMTRTSRAEFERRVAAYELEQLALARRGLKW